MREDPPSNPESEWSARLGRLTKEIQALTDAVGALRAGSVPRLAGPARRPSAPVRLSVVVPCMDEEAVISETCRRLVTACEGCVGDDFEVIFVNDGSRDCTLEILKGLADADERLVAVDLARNFGHQLALSAGLSLCRGERVLMIDADLQDPPELLPRMMTSMDEGADVVYGQRSGRKGEGLFKKASATAFYRLLGRLAHVRIPNDTGDFRLINRRVLEAFLAMPEQHRFVRGMVAWLGFRQVAVPYVREARFAGDTKYPLRKMVQFAVDAITGFSIVPLRFSIYVSAASFGMAVLLCLYVIYSWLFLDTVQGWTSIALTLLVFFSVVLLSLGIIGEYVGRTYVQVKGRPLFLIGEIFCRPGDPDHDRVDADRDSA